jgi:hypothetical protein
MRPELGNRTFGTAEEIGDEAVKSFEEDDRFAGLLTKGFESGEFSVEVMVQH